MESKYYTPEISEFYIGFEYETFEWSKDELGLPENNYERWGKYAVDNKSLEFIGKYGIGKVRVKYLDKEDIENLGFIYSGTTIDNWYSLNINYIRPLSNHSNNSISLKHDFRTNQGIVITAFEFENLKGEEEQIYRGECKNKSELKKLMKQLNIK